MSLSIDAPIEPIARVLLDLDALSQNWKKAQELKSKETEIIAVVKADAYGHGAVTISKYLTGKVNAFAVAQPLEAIELRKVGILDPILVLCPPQEEWAYVYSKWNLQAVLGQLEQLDWLPDGAEVHLKIDTGMNRIGISPDQSQLALARLQKSNLKPVGLMSHFANADLPGHPSISKQLDIFKSVSSEFPSEWKRHIANTAAFNTREDSHFNAVRIGLMLYGYMPNGLPDPGLKPVKRWSAPITQVKPVKAGEPVSYGWTWSAPADGWLGVVPAGYADGYPRSLSCKSTVDLEDGPVQLAGRVTMDYIIVWTDRRPLKIGEQAILLGGPTTNADHLAKQADSISYELLCTMGHVRQR